MLPGVDTHTISYTPVFIIPMNDRVESSLVLIDFYSKQHESQAVLPIQITSLNIQMKG